MGHKRFSAHMCFVDLEKSPLRYFVGGAVGAWGIGVIFKGCQIAAKLK